MKKKKLKKRIKQLEEHSHPPVTFVECKTCYCVVFEGVWLEHVEWHNEK